MSQITNAKPNSAACTQWRRQGGGQPGHVPRSGCAPAVGWPLGGRDSSSQLTKLSQMLQMLGTGGCVLLQMSPLILSRQSMPPVVTAVQCQCEVTLAVAAWLSQLWLGLGRGGAIPTPSAILLTRRLDVSCVVCLNANNHAQKILHTLTTGGGHGPPGPPLDPPLRRDEPSRLADRSQQIPAGRIYRCGVT